MEKYLTVSIKYFNIVQSLRIKTVFKIPKVKVLIYF